MCSKLPLFQSDEGSLLLNVILTMGLTLDQVFELDLRKRRGWATLPISSLSISRRETKATHFT